MDITEFARMGGKARAARLSPEVRKQIARKAIAARWVKAGKQTPILASKKAPGKDDICNKCGLAFWYPLHHQKHMGNYHEFQA